MGEAAEARDHVAMAPGIIQIFFEGTFVLRRHGAEEIAKTFDRSFLMRQSLGMLERQIKKHPFNRAEFPVHAALETFES